MEKQRKLTKNKANKETKMTNLREKDQTEIKNKLTHVLF